MLKGVLRVQRHKLLQVNQVHLFTTYHKFSGTCTQWDMFQMKEWHLCGEHMQELLSFDFYVDLFISCAKTTQHPKSNWNINAIIFTTNPASVNLVVVKKQFKHLQR